MPHGRDVRIFRRPEVGAGGARGPHEVPRARDFVQRIGDEGEADRPDYVEAEGHRGRAGDAGQARRPRVYWIGAKSLYARRGLSLATGMGDDEKRKAFLKGFEEGLKAAWREIAALMTRGRVMASRPRVSSGCRSPPVRKERTWRSRSPPPWSTSHPPSRSSLRTAGTRRSC